MQKVTYNCHEYSTAIIISILAAPLINNGISRRGRFL